MYRIISLDKHSETLRSLINLRNLISLRKSRTDLFLIDHQTLPDS